MTYREDRHPGMRVVSVCQSSDIDRALYRAIYGRILSGHRDVWASFKKGRIPQGCDVNISSDYFARRVRAILLVREAWKKSVSRIHGYFDMKDQDEESFGYSTLADMHKCHPAALVLRAQEHRRTCRRYAICPFCRYRLGRQVFERLLPYAKGATHVALFSIRIGGDPHVLDWRARATIMRTITKYCRTWSEDACVTLPYKDKKTQTWGLRMAFICLTNRPNNSPELDELEFGASLEKTQASVEPWEFRKFSQSSLAACVAEAVRYEPELLYAMTKSVDLFRIAQTTKHARTAYHGLRGR